MKATISTQKNKHFYEVFLLILMISFLLNNTVLAQYKNTATATASAPGGIQVLDISNNGSTLNQPSGVQTPINFPMIGLGKTASTPILQSNGTYNVDYTFTLKNFGQLALQNVQVADVLTTTFPSPVTYTLRSAITVSGGTGLTLNASFTGTNSTQNLLVAASSTLAVGESRTITIPLNISLNGAIGTFNNSATTTATTADNTSVFDTSNNSLNPDGNGDGNPMNDSAPTPILFLSPDIQVLKTVNNAAPTAGTNITFTITAKNNGAGDAQNVVVNDVLSAGYAYVTSAATAGTYDAATGIWQVGNLANGISRTLTITVKVLYSKPVSVYQNTASSNYSGDNTPSNNSQTVTVTPQQVAPDAVNDAITGVAATANATLNLLANDVLADGSAATPSLVTVDLNAAVAGIQTTYNASGQGVWTYDAASGNITFTPNAGFTVSPTAITYILTETATGLSDQATVTVTKAANTDVTLRDLTVNQGTLSPLFTSSNPNYTVNVPYTTNSITVNAVANDANATISINGGTVPNTVLLNVGTNTIPVLVTAQDGSTRQTYTITVTREKAPQVISFTAPATKTFGDADFMLNASSTNPSIQVTYTSDNPSVATIVNNNVHLVGTGTVNFTASQAGNASYLAAADVIRTLTVNPAGQTITFSALSQKIYGDADFTLTAYNSSGLPVTYSSSDVSIASVNGSAVTIHKAGNVILTASQTGNANYSAAVSVSQTLIINPKTLTANLIGTVSKVYDGNTNAVFTGANFSLSGKVGTDDVTLNYPLTGNYYGRFVNARTVVGASGLSLTGSDKANYVLNSTTIFDYVGVITPATLQVNLVGTVAKTYDGNNAATLTAANYQLLGLMNTSDRVEFTKPLSGVYDNSSAGNNKLVSVSGIVLSGGEANNYILPVVNIGANIGSINLKMVTVSADNQSRLYNAPNPVLTLRYDGFVNGETAADLSAQPSISTTATTTSANGNYPITASGAASNNYNFTYVNGVLTVGQSGNVITFAAIPNKNYGDADFTLNATASSGLDVRYTSSNPAVATVDLNGNVHILSAGNTTITAAQPGNNNYTAAVNTDQILSVNKAPLTITADNKVKSYGAVNPPLTYTFNGFVNGETAAVLTAQPSISTTATTTSANGNYPITASGAISNNYNFTYVNGVLTVGQSGNVITFNSIPNKTYGDADFTLNAIASSGLDVNYSSSNPAVATVDLNGNVHILSAGNTTITAAQPGNNNYTAAVNADQILSVNKAPLIITADDKTRNYGSANPIFTATYSGFVNGETASVLTAQPSISTLATTTSPAGNYAINISGAATDNYEITYVPGTLTVKQTALNSLNFAQENVYENQSAGMLAGTFSAASADPNAVFTYTFSGGNGANDNASFRISGDKLFTTTAFDYEAKNSYLVTVRATDAHGLFLDQNFNIQISDVNEAPTLAAISNQAGCYSTSAQNLQLGGITAGPESNQTVMLSVQTDHPELFNGLQISSAVSGKAILSYQLAAAGTAKITVTVRDNGGTANGGADSFSRIFTITANAMPVAAISTPKTKISKGETITLKASGGNIYRWDNTAGITGSLSSAEIQIRPAQTTTYQVLVSNTSGCSNTASVTIEVEDDYTMVKPANLLTPNGDGKNDTWVVQNIDMFPESGITIFDRGGRQLLHVQHYQNDWSGTFQGAPLTEGTYYYVIDFGPGKAPLRGFFTILRNR